MTTAVILAGGQGRRMGGNKPFYAHGFSTLIEAVIARLRSQSDALYVNASHHLMPDFEKLGLPLVNDDPDFAGLGPLSGVLTALELAAARGEETVVTVPCDMPDLPLDLVEQLVAAPSTDVVYFTGRSEYPLCALWRTTVTERLKAMLDENRDSGGLAVWRFVEQVQVCKVITTDDAAFANINMPQPKAG
jgi:molybdenum cofactor guanylyltransferase